MRSLLLVNVNPICLNDNGIVYVYCRDNGFCIHKKNVLLGTQGKHIEICSRFTEVKTHLVTLTRRCFRLSGKWMKSEEWNQ